MKIIAVKDLRYGAVDYFAGDLIDASDRHGRVLVAIGKAREAIAGDDQLTPAVPATKPKRQTYKTRRLTAKD